MTFNSKMTGTIASRLTHFVENLQFEDLPAEVVEKAKYIILDTVGVCIGSAQYDFARSASDLVVRWAGAPEATVIGRSVKLPAHHAAFANGVLAHGNDYDDTHTESVVHASAALVPAMLAMAERTQVSGRAAITALVAGMEIAIRVALPAFNRFHLRGFHTTSVATVFGAAAVAARLDRAGFEGTVNALGIAGSFASGLMECVPAGAGAKRLHAGWAALSGIVAAQLATAGYTGPQTVFEGGLGLYSSFLRGESLDLSLVEQDLGQQWHMLDSRPKLYACCGYLQAIIDATATLRRDHDIRPSQVAAIQCWVPEGAARIVCEPWDKRMAPVSAYDTRFSLPFVVALMLSQGRADMDDFSELRAGEPEIRELMDKVRYGVDPVFRTSDLSGRVEIRTKAGGNYTAEVREIRGNRRNPITSEELLKKFDANASVLEASARRQVRDVILSLDKQPDIRSLMAGLS